MTDGIAGDGAQRWGAASLRLVRIVCCMLGLTHYVGVAVGAAAVPPATERVYLSGQGPADAVPWQFTITGGRRTGEAATIPVPSNWELHGFGTYRYGQELNKEVCVGHYRTTFTVPDAWRGRRIRLVFAGAMTDTTVHVNGQLAGPTHQGGFTQFRYDVTPLIRFGAAKDNVLEVDVRNASTDPDTELAERGGDYWVFGGIYRPVWLESCPAESIEHVAMDARADGTYAADIELGQAPTRVRSDGLELMPERIEGQVLDGTGRPVGDPVSAAIPAGGVGELHLVGRIDNPRLWSAETPNLYTLRFVRWRGNEPLHTVSVRFGFRTFEVRDGLGLFLNGHRILLKGVSRHSFRPETGRALTRENCYDDVRLIRSMNMNAVRMSHYPPDEAFLEACDELGLYVLDELSGWQHANATPIGRRLVREMVRRDVNHPSILFWDNGNEGGFNRDLDADFALYDPQRRRVLHPWDTFGGIDTKHYMSYDDFVRRLKGPNLVMPTEQLHGMYDGGAGSGLHDYWNALEASPFGGGLFIWNFADEGVVRTDRGGRVDVFSTFAPDGIMGPHFEKEGSYFAIRDIWSPVQLTRPRLDATFTGTIAVRNAYDFIDLSQCRFSWRLQRLTPNPTTLASGTTECASIAPHAAGNLHVALPAGWLDADLLQVTATDPRGDPLWTWAWPIEAAAERSRLSLTPEAVGAVPAIAGNGDAITLSAAGVNATFDRRSGELRRVTRNGTDFVLRNGPRLVCARPATAAPIGWLPLGSDAAASPEQHLATPQLANAIEVTTDLPPRAPFAAFTIELSADGEAWRTIFAGSRRPGDGALFQFPPQQVAAVRVSRIRDSDGRPLHLKGIRVGFAAGRFPAAPTGSVQVASGVTADGAWVDTRGGGIEDARWTLRPDGSLRLDYRYALTGNYLYHGITFDLSPRDVASLHWIGDGPYRVWQNRLRGTAFGEYAIARHDLQPGESWDYPEFQGYFAEVQSADIALVTGGQIVITNPDPAVFLRIGTPRISHPDTTVDFPAGDLSFLFAIPAMASKFKTLAESGPSAQPAHASGEYAGSLVFRFRSDQPSSATP